MAAKSDKPEGLQPQHKLMLFILSLGLIAGGFYYLVILPIDEQIANQQAATAKARNEIKKVKDFKGEEESIQLRAQQVELDRKLEKNRELIPKEVDENGLMATILEFGRQSGLVIISKTPLPMQFSDKYKVLPIAMKVQGSFGQVVKFFLLLSRVEDRLASAGVSGSSLELVVESSNHARLKRLVNIRDIKISQSRSRGTSNRGQSETGKALVKASKIEASFVVQAFSAVEPPPPQPKQEPGKKDPKKGPADGKAATQKT